MAFLKIEATPDGIVKYELSFREQTFDFSMIPNEDGATGDKPGFAFQIEDHFNEDNEELLEALDNITFADTDELGKFIMQVAEHE